MSKCAGMHTVGKLIRIASAVMALLAGCSSYEKLPQQNANRDYQVYMVTTGTGGDLTLFLIKAFEVDGKVAMCVVALRVDHLLWQKISIATSLTFHRSISTELSLATATF